MSVRAVRLLFMAAAVAPMQALLRLEDAMDDFLAAWRCTGRAERTAAARTGAYRNAFATAVTVRHALQEPLMTGPPNHRVLCTRVLDSHPLAPPCAPAGGGISADPEQDGDDGVERREVPGRRGPLPDQPPAAGAQAP
ncbi:MAG: hypothetical protein EOO40_05385 [Deltaproteobacteria bacterium]|nr:MAG: hypothetical protein EOO40_05385 [Deltaproteobacteria bacterium]